VATKRTTRRGHEPVAFPFQCEPEFRTKVRNRLARLRGQVEALRRLVDEDPDCELFVQQLSAAKAALDRILVHVLSELTRMAAEATDETTRQELANRVADLIRRYR